MWMGNAARGCPRSDDPVAGGGDLGLERATSVISHADITVIEQSALPPTKVSFAQ